MNTVGALQHLSSEGGELAQAAIKLIQGKGSRKLLEQELGDVLALAELLMKHNVIRSEKVHDRKLVKLKSYGRMYG
ncbi:nucleoside triphosphate pyrophosphohydrolase family protein [Burkholderia cenocepacia]|uniref:hypothetical protein n=1 Tax=Burkholderia cenocepacia TaxID=95486 RepID=UPI002AAFF31A|nr:hypothetical protein [Burkholderia cenocepacia]